MTAPNFPTPHLEKLSAALVNEKLPAPDAPRLEAALARYHQWINELDAVTGASAQIVKRMVS
ncbi:MAG: Bpu10I family restriction endonuclease, partial [Blastocatellia bacterium]